MNMSTLDTGTHHQITNARLQYFKDWLHSRAPTLQAVIECNLRSTSLELAPSPPGNYPFKARIKFHLLFAGIISSPISPR